MCGGEPSVAAQDLTYSVNRDVIELLFGFTKAFISGANNSFNSFSCLGIQAGVAPNSEEI